MQVHTNPDITLFGYEFKLTSFVNDVSYFLQDLKSIKELLWLLKSSEQFTSLKVNCEKSEICGIGSKKGIMGAFSNITFVDIVNDTVKILGCHHSYNKQLADDQNFLDAVCKYPVCAELMVLERAITTRQDTNFQNIRYFTNSVSCFYGSCTK